MANLQEKKTLTPKQVHEIYQISPSTLAIWRHKKKGPPYCKVEGRVYYLEKDLDEFFELNKMQTEEV